MLLIVAIVMAATVAVSFRDFKESDKEDDDLFQYNIDNSITNIEVDIQKGKEIDKQSRQEIREPNDELIGREVELT